MTHPYHAGRPGLVQTGQALVVVDEVTPAAIAVLKANQADDITRYRHRYPWDDQYPSRLQVLLVPLPPGTTVAPAANVPGGPWLGAAFEMPDGEHLLCFEAKADDSPVVLSVMYPPNKETHHEITSIVRDRIADDSSKKGD